MCSDKMPLTASVSLITSSISSPLTVTVRQSLPWPATRTNRQEQEYRKRFYSKLSIRSLTTSSRSSRKTTPTTSQSSPALIYVGTASRISGGNMSQTFLSVMGAQQKPFILNVIFFSVSDQSWRLMPVPQVTPCEPTPNTWDNFKTSRNHTSLQIQTAREQTG